MDYTTHILLLSLCAVACAAAYEPFGVVVQSRAGARPLYAADFMEEYEPYAYAAVPLPAPVPLFHIVAPHTPNKYKARKPTRRPARQPERRPEREYVFAAASGEQTYEAYSQESETATEPKYSNLYEEDTVPVYVYARPNKNGGYTYRKPSVSSGQPLQQREPFIVRIHRYRTSRER